MDCASTFILRCTKTPTVAPALLLDRFRHCSDTGRLDAASRAALEWTLPIKRMMRGCYLARQTYVILEITLLHLAPPPTQGW